MFAQDFNTSSKKAIKYYQKAMYFYESQNFEEAARHSFLALDKDSNFMEPYLLLGEMAYQIGNKKNEIYYFSKAIEKDSTKYPNVYHLLASSYLSIDKYEEALPLLYKFLEINKDVKYNEKTLKSIEICKFRIHAKANPVEFKPERMPETINTKYDEYFPTVTADGKTLIFTRLLPTEGLNPMVGEYHEDIYVANFKDNKWVTAESIGANVNNYNNQGAQIISASGESMIYTDCTCEDGTIRCCDLYIAYLSNNIWNKGIKLGKPVNTAYWESQPCLSADGRTLFFVSNREGGKGQKDIWKITQKEDGSWSEAINLGDSINTAGNEMGPFLHSDSKTFYFSSDGWTGMGELDIFVAEMKPDKKFGTAKNLGYPINTSGSEFRIVIDAKAEYAYYSSDIAEATKQDIYKFQLYPEIRPQKTIYVKGKIFDAETKEPLSANYEILNLETKKLENYNNNIDNFFICLPIEKNYALNVSQTGYLFHSENFSLKELNDTLTNFYLNVYLSPVKKGNKIILKNIFFETDSYLLKEISFVELDKLVDFLTLNASIKIEIGGHTDNQGSEKHNLVLSENRAKTVVEYLISKGISAKRLTYKGYGYSEPISDNITPEGRALNRRTEFKITE